MPMPSPGTTAILFFNASVLLKRERVENKPGVGGRQSKLAGMTLAQKNLTRPVPKSSLARFFPKAQLEVPEVW